MAGVQLSANEMLRIGDWIALPNGSANGIVKEITLNTVKIQNWDNTISTIPPYTLVNGSFQNWRGMQESGGRRVDKNIYLDMTTLKFCTPEMLDTIRKEVPLMASRQKARYLQCTTLPYLHRTLSLQPSCREPGFGLDYQPEGNDHLWSSHSGLLLFPKQGMEGIRTYSVRYIRSFAGDGTEV